MYIFKHHRARTCLGGRTRKCLAIRSSINGLNELRRYSWEFYPSFLLGNCSQCRVLSKFNECKFRSQIFIAGYTVHDKKDKLASDPRLILEKQNLRKIINWTKYFSFFSLSFITQNFYQRQEITCLCLWESTVGYEVILNKHRYWKICCSFSNVCVFL